MTLFIFSFLFINCEYYAPLNGRNVFLRSLLPRQFYEARLTLEKLDSDLMDVGKVIFKSSTNRLCYRIIVQVETNNLRTNHWTKYFFEESLQWIRKSSHEYISHLISFSSYGSIERILISLFRNEIRYRNGKFTMEYLQFIHKIHFKYQDH